MDKMKAPTKSIFLTVVILGFVILTIALTFFTDFEYMTLISKSSYGSYKKIQVTAAPPPAGSAAAVPRLAYLIAGSKGQLESLWRTVLAVYHPRNQYVLHIDLDSAVTERMELIQRVEKHPLFSSVGNVHVVKRSNMVTYRGPTMVANTLHACAILLNISKDWDWFINLSAADYPLVSQDDILKMFSKVDRNMNFVEHSSNLGWKEWDRGNPLMIDPGLYSNRKADVFFTTEKRELPSQFKLFTGSAWMGLTREFVEYCILGIDNLPRTLLMYYTNFVSSPEGYFQTVICNSPEFNSTVVNNDLHYISWPDPPQQHPAPILTQQFDVLLASGAPFARKFSSGTRVLDMIDSQLLGRSNGSVTPGGWCAGVPACSRVGNISSLQLTRGFRRIKKKVRILMKERGENTCI